MLSYKNSLIISLIVGLVLFGERHTIIQYVGGVIIIGAIILIAFERSLDENSTYTDFQNEKHFVALFWALLTCISFSWMIIITKWACFYYNANVVEYSWIAMGLSGIIGSLSFIPLQYYQTPLEHKLTTNIVESLMLAIWAGILTTIGQTVYFTAVSRGSIEVAQLFVNMKSIVQLIEEIIFLSIVPNFFALWGVGIAIFGAVLVIFGGKEHHNKPKIDSSE